MFQRGYTEAQQRRSQARRGRPRGAVGVERLEERCLLSGGSVPAGCGQLPLSFESNQGETGAAVNFLARGPGYGLFLTPTQAVLSLHQAGSAGAAAASPGDVLGMQLVGGNAHPQVAGLDELAGKSNY